MRINIKLFLIMLIICNVNNNTFASDNDNKNPQLNQYFEERSKPIDYLTIKIITNKDTNKMEVVDPIKFTSSQLLYRFVEKTEFNNIKSITGQDVTSIVDVLSKLNDKDLSINNIQNLSLGTLKFIAEGVLTYEEISPDIAMEQYNKEVDKYNKSHKEKLPILKENEVQEARQKDINEIEARETLQALEKEYNEIMKDNELGNDQNTREVLQIFEEAVKNSTDNTVKNSLIDLFMIKDESGNIELTVTPEEMKELKKILKVVTAPLYPSNTDPLSLIPLHRYHPYYYCTKE